MKKLGYAIITLTLGVFMTVYYLTMFIKSYNKYNDGWGTDYALDMNILVKMFCGIVVLIVGAYALYQVKKNQEESASYTIGLGLVGMLSTVYPLGMVCKMLTYWIQDGKAKYISKYTWEYYLRISDYLIWAAFGAVILAYGIVRYVAAKLNK